MADAKAHAVENGLPIDWECDNCGYISAVGAKSCKHCGKKEPRQKTLEEVAAEEEARRVLVIEQKALAAKASARAESFNAVAEENCLICDTHVHRSDKGHPGAVCDCRQVERTEQLRSVGIHPPCCADP